MPPACSRARPGSRSSPPRRRADPRPGGRCAGRRRPRSARAARRAARSSRRSPRRATAGSRMPLRWSAAPSSSGTGRSSGSCVGSRIASRVSQEAARSSSACPYDRSVSSQLESLQRVTDAALAYLSEDDLLTALLDRIAEILRSDTAAILMLEPSGERLVARAAKGIEEEVEQGVTIPVGRGFAGRVVAERRAIEIPDVDHADILNPILREKGIRSLLGVPLVVEGRPIGVLHVGSLTPRDFTGEDKELLQLAADRAALAIDNAHLYMEERRARQRLESLAAGDGCGARLHGRGRAAERAARASDRPAADRHRGHPHARRERRDAEAARGDGARGGGRAGVRDPGRSAASPGGSPPSAGRSRSPTSKPPRSSTRSCTRRASARCSGCRCSSRAA